MPDEDNGHVLLACADPVPTWRAGDVQSWQPDSAAGIACAHSPSLSACVVHGGLTPCSGRSDILCVGRVERAAGVDQLPALSWSRLAPSMAIPARCDHGAAILSGAVSGGDRLLLFGGEGEPNRSRPRTETQQVGPVMMNDTWTIHLATGVASPRLATHGAPPAPRRGHAVVAFREPPTSESACAPLRHTAIGLAAATRCVTTHGSHSAHTAPVHSPHRQCRTRLSLSARTVSVHCRRRTVSVH
jgi:hypothetical protein